MNTFATPQWPTRSLGRTLATIFVCSCVAGCQSHGGSGRASDGPAPVSAASAAAAKPIDACSMLTAQDISGLLGSAVPGRSTEHDPRMGGCEWHNSTTEESVTVQIGSPGTAPKNILPSPVVALPGIGGPAPDGMRFTGFGTVEFAGGNRQNSVQVAVIRLSGDERDAAAVTLARKISPQVPQ